MAASISVETAARGAKTLAALESLRQSPKKLLIHGRWLAPKSGKTFETINPANEEVLALIGKGDKADVDKAVKAARTAFEEGKWPKMGRISALG
jgi:phenylacetaldehyde dehydrogenase